MAYASTINEDKFLVENFVTGCTLYRIHTSRADIQAILEDEYKTASVLYTGKSNQPSLGGLVYTYLAVVPSNIHWHDVDDVIIDEKHSHFMTTDEHTSSYYENLLLEL